MQINDIVLLQPPLDTNKLWELAPDQFWETSKIIFNWQAAHNPIYKQWVALNKSSAIPFLPISFFINLTYCLNVMGVVFFILLIFIKKLFIPYF